MSVPFLQGQLMLDEVVDISAGGSNWVMNNSDAYYVISSGATPVVYLEYEYTPAINGKIDIKLIVNTSSATANQEFYLEIYEYNSATPIGRSQNRNHATTTVAESFFCFGEMALVAGTTYRFQARINKSAAGNQTVYKDALTTKMHLIAHANP